MCFGNAGHNMNEARRSALRVIGNVLDVLVKELDKLADEEKAAFESRQPGSRDSSSGDESKQAHSILEEAANAVSNHAVELDELTKKPS
jgi:hypothetical protein